MAAFGTHSLVQLRPHRGTDFISFGRALLATGADGAVSPEEPLHGFWFFETRMLSKYRWLVDGHEPELAGSSPVAQDRWLGYFIRQPSNWRETATHEEQPSQQTVELRLSRWIGEGLHEDVELTNHTQIATSVRLELAVEADFADEGELRGGREQRGTLTRTFRASPDGRGELVFEYRVEHAYEHQGESGVASMVRSIALDVNGEGPPPVEEGERLVFQVALAPRASWRACLSWTPTIDGRAFEAPRSCPGLAEAEPPLDRLARTFVERSTKIEVPADGLAGIAARALERARDDLATLRLVDLDVDERSWVLAGGVPTYLTLFGRDALMASWESSLLSPEMMRGALQRLADSQGERERAWLDEQPGRIIHEMHAGPLAALRFSPHGRYYGDATSSLFYPYVVSMLWHWSGKREVVRPLVDTALRALAWADRDGDPDRDGFYEYRTLSEQGEKNQGWKDSEDAIVYPDGSQVKDPLGTCEMQGFAYASKMALAEVLFWLGEIAQARRLYNEAVELKKRFNEAFWMEDEQFFALGLDRDKRQIGSIACDPGLCLSSGIVDSALVPKVVSRLMDPELFSGWGIRTLSSKHPAYDPFAYHRGTVWPLVNAMIALGLARHGYVRELHVLCEAQLEAASLFENVRLPECFAGHARDEAHPFPGLYPRANWPQAWSSSALFSMMEAMLGIYPYAAIRVLFVDPWLPEWLPELTVRDLHVGDAKVTIRFRRKRDGAEARTDFEVLEREGPLRVVRQAHARSLFASVGARIRDAIESFLPRADRGRR